MRFGQIEKAIDNISAKVLTQHLKELELYGFISRKTYDVIQPKVEYSVIRVAAANPTKTLFWNISFSSKSESS